MNRLRGTRWIGLAVAVWAVALAAVTIRVAMAPIERANVYRVFHAAGLNWTAGHALYDTNHLFRYSPAYAAAFVPLTWLPERWAGLLFRAIGVMLLGWALSAWWHYQGLWRASALAALALLSLPLTIGNINNGQANPHLLAALLAAVLGVAHGRPSGAAIAAAAALWMKYYPLSLGLLLTLVVPRTFGWRYALAIFGLGILPFFLQAGDYVADQYVAWGRHLLGPGQRIDVPLNEAPRDFWLLCRLGAPGLPRWSFHAVQLLSAAGLAIWTAAAVHHLGPTPAVFNTLLGGALCWMLLFGMASESATYILATPVVVGGLVAAWQNRTPWQSRLGWLLSYGLLAGAQLVNWLPGGIRWHALGAQPLAALLLAWCVLRTAPTWPRSARRGSTAATHTTGSSASMRSQQSTAKPYMAA